MANGVETSGSSSTEDEKQSAIARTDASPEDSKHEEKSGIASRQNDDDDHAELPAEPPTEQPAPAGEDYSILKPAQKKAIVLTASLASLFSPMATAIYCEDIISTSMHPETDRLLDPSLNTIANDLNVTNSKINITVTVFLVCSYLPLKEY
jgi:hypothetical protein